MNGWWSVLKAARAYLTLPEADRDEQWQRACICAACPSLTVYDETLNKAPMIVGLLGWARSGFCGSAPDGSPGWKPDAGTCGCLVLAQTDAGEYHGLTVKGRPMEPAGKTTREGKICVCPQGKW
jgi:hypothetical protein